MSLEEVFDSGETDPDGKFGHFDIYSTNAHWN